MSSIREVVLDMWAEREKQEKVKGYMWQMGKGGQSAELAALEKRVRSLEVKLGNMRKLVREYINGSNDPVS